MVCGSPISEGNSPSLILASRLPAASFSVLINGWSLNFDKTGNSISRFIPNPNIIDLTGLNRYGLWPTAAIKNIETKPEPSVSEGILAIPPTAVIVRSSTLTVHVPMYSRYLRAQVMSSGQIGGVSRSAFVRSPPLPLLLGLTINLSSRRLGNEPLLGGWPSKYE